MNQLPLFSQFYTQGKKDLLVVDNNEYDDDAGEVRDSDSEESDDEAEESDSDLDSEEEKKR